MNHPQHGQPWHPQDQTYHLAPPPGPEKRRRRWPWVLLGVPIGMLVMLVLIGIGNGPTRAAAPTTTPAASGGSVSTADTSAVTSSEAPTAPPGPLTTFGEGTWEGYFETQGRADWARAE